jgi:hypothetical protein
MTSVWLNLALAAGVLAVLGWVLWDYRRDGLVVKVPGIPPDGAILRTQMWAVVLLTLAVTSLIAAAAALVRIEDPSLLEPMRLLSALFRGIAMTLLLGLAWDRWQDRD